MRRHTCLLAAVAAVFASTLHAADGIKPAGEIIAAMAVPPAPSRPAKPGARATLRDDAAALAASVAALPPEEAAGRWLVLSDRQRASLHDRGVMREYESPVRFEAIFAAMPTAEQLPALKAALDERPLDDAGGQRVAFLKMLVATLRDDAAGIDAAFADLRAAALARQTPPARIDARFVEFRNALAGKAAGGKTPLETFERAMGEKNPFINNSYVPSLDVPDLVTLVGQERATTLLERALKCGKRLQVRNGDETAKLARTLALAAVETSNVAQWSLCEHVDAVELYEATAKKFPKKTKGDENGFEDYERRNSRPYYLIGLIVRGRSDDAIKVATDPGEQLATYTITNIAQRLAGNGFDEQLYQFLKRVAVADPGTSLWDVLVPTAARSGHANELLAFAREVAAKPGQSPESRRAANRHLADALLAADQVDEGIELMRANVASGDAGAELTSVVRRATIGRILGRPAIVADALDDATKRMLAMDDKGADASALAAWADEMRRAGRSPELSAALARQVAAIKPTSGHSYSVPDSLVALADVYYRADMPLDLLAMLDGLSQWSSADLADLPIESGSHDVTKPIAFYAAWAMAEADRPEQSAAVLNFLLDRRGGLDAAYALLIETDADAKAKLDALFARDPFEERPLIWKATLQLKADKLDEAEATLKQAIAIDPSDGEQGKGDRMRVYAVLADVMAAKGDAKQAELLRGVVTSIRMSEDADDAWSAGLLTRAIAQYEAALTHFADAYCIQSRLAIQLASLGRDAEAEAHYQRAYELMPDSFGRVESHCFGCEGAFRSGAAQGIAERVFTGLLAKSPHKPQLHYLLGYLRKSQGRYADALASLRLAVALDPKYLNAWKLLAECGEHVALPDDERDRATLAMLSLDPLGRHSSPRLNLADDVGALYAAASAAAKVRPVAPASLYPLRAAKIRLAAEADAEREHGAQSWSSDASESAVGKSAGTAIADHPRVVPIVRWMDEFGQ